MSDNIQHTPWCYAYEFTDPFSGEPMWIVNETFWNQQKPKASMGLYWGADYAALRSQLAEARELIERYASECGECGGKGWFYEGDAVTGRGPDDVFPEKAHCHECADIRTLLAKLPEGR